MDSVDPQNIHTVFELGSYLEENDVDITLFSTCWTFDLEDGYVFESYEKVTKDTHDAWIYRLKPVVTSTK